VASTFDNSWKNELTGVIQNWANRTKKQVIISPDIDGISSCSILSQEFDIEIIGLYNTSNVILFGETSVEEAKNALWLDLDVNQIGISCIGQHLLYQFDNDQITNREPNSWNPNVWQSQSWKNSFSGLNSTRKDKFPFGTMHFLWDLFNEGKSLTKEQIAVMAHSDGTWFALDNYKRNGEIWSDLMFSKSNWTTPLLNYRAESGVHNVHKIFVDEIYNIGFKSTSQARHRNTLVNELSTLIGRQSIVQSPKKKPEEYFEKLTKGFEVVSSMIGRMPRIRKGISVVIEGKKDFVYPPVENLDKWLLENKVFSHIFQGQTKLSYTTGLVLE
jgi:hypothetical protein